MIVAMIVIMIVRMIVIMLIMIVAMIVIFSETDPASLDECPGRTTVGPRL